jgi:arylsulfatase A-like enzyme
MRRLLLPGLIVGVVSAFGCGAGSQDAAREEPRGAGRARPNILFVLLDDLRWDTLGYAGHPYVKTPQIDRIANEGVTFRNAFCTTSLCSPSRASSVASTLTSTA